VFPDKCHISRKA